MNKSLIKFFGVVKNGKVCFDNPEQYESHLLTLEEKRIELTIQKEQLSRSNQQSRYLFGVIYQAISDETGYTKEEVHEMMKSILLKDHKVVNDKRYTVVRSTSSLTTTEMSEFIEGCKRFAATELSLNIPDAINFN